MVLGKWLISKNIQIKNNWLSSIMLIIGVIFILPFFYSIFNSNSIDLLKKSFMFLIITIIGVFIIIFSFISLIFFNKKSN